MGQRAQDREAGSTTGVSGSSRHPSARRDRRTGLPEKDPRLTTWIAVVLVSMLPLVFDPGGFHIFLPLKWLIATVAVMVGLAAAAREGLSVSAGLVLRMWFVLIGVFTLAAVVSTAPLTSVIGSAGRNLGLIAWVVFAAAFLLGTTIARDLQGKGALALAAVTTAIPVSLYGIAQWGGLDPLEWQEGIDLSRARSTFGNAAFLGGYLVMVVPLAIALATDSSLLLRGRWVSGVSAAAGTSALLATQTRGAWLGMLAGLVVLAVSSRHRMRLTRASVIAGVSTLVVLFSALVLTPLGERAVSIADIGEGTARGRLLTWSRTAELIADRPVLGWGLDTFGLVFPRVIDAEYEREVGRSTIPDRAHNVFMDLSVSVGVLGLLAFLLLVFLIGRRSMKSIAISPINAGAAAGVVGYFIQQQFSLQLADLDALWWLMAGMVAGGTGSTVPLPRILSPVLAAVAAAALIWTGRDVVADRMLRGALEAESSGRAYEALEASARAARISPERGQYLQASARLARRVGESGGPRHLFEDAMTDLDDAKRFVPSREFDLDRGNTLLAWGEATGDLAKVKAAEAVYRSILDQDPHSARVLLKLGVCLIHGNDPAGAEGAWAEAAELSPRSVGPHLNLAMLYERLGRGDEAEASYRAVLNLDPDNGSARAGLARLAR